MEANKTNNNYKKKPNGIYRLLQSSWGGQKGYGNRDKKGIPQNGPEIPSRFESEQQGIRKKIQGNQ
jgi:hypothetical protein